LAVVVVAAAAAEAVVVVVVVLSCLSCGFPLKKTLVLSALG
jgi:hypothetical protein